MDEDTDGDTAFLDTVTNVLSVADPAQSSDFSTRHPSSTDVLLPYIAIDNPWLMLPLPDRLRPHLQWWQDMLNVLEGISLWQFNVTYHLYISASLEGLGAHLDDQIRVMVIRRKKFPRQCVGTQGRDQCSLPLETEAKSRQFDGRHR